MAVTSNDIESLQRAETPPPLLLPVHVAAAYPEAGSIGPQSESEKSNAIHQNQRR